MNSFTKLFPHLTSCNVLTKYFSITKQTYFPSNSTKFIIKSNNLSSTTNSSHQNSNSTKISNGFFKITLRRSVIGLPSKRRLVVQALGLRRLQQTVYHSQTAYIAGMILKVKELLQVKNVKRIPAPEERKKVAEKGYVIIKKHNPNLLLDES